MPLASNFLRSSRHGCRISLYPYLVIYDAGDKSKRLISFSLEGNWFGTLPITKYKADTLYLLTLLPKGFTTLRSSWYKIISMEFSGELKSLFA